MNKKSLLLLVVSLNYFITLCYSSNNLSDSFSLSPKSRYPGSAYNVGYGVVNSKDLNTPVKNAEEFHKLMTSPENANFFGGLAFALKTYLETGDESFKPLIMLQTFGGGADIAGALLKGKWMLNILSQNHDLRNAFEQKTGKQLTPEALIENKLIEFNYLGCPEKRISHEGIFSENTEAKGAHHAFYDGMRIPNAGIMPEELKDSLPVTLSQANKSEPLKLIHEITPSTHFVMTVPEKDGTLKKVDGRPLEDSTIIPYTQKLLGINKIYILTLNGTIGEARKEMLAFIKDKTSKTTEGKSVKSPLGRKSRPCFCIWPDTGGDTFMTRSNTSTTTQIISPVNEAYNIMVSGSLILERGDLELCSMMALLGLTVDGESDADTANKALENLRKTEAVTGVVYRYPPELIQDLMKNLFGVAQKSPPLLQSHANLKFFKLIWKSAVFFDLGLRKYPESLSSFLTHMKPLTTLGTMPRYDVPVISKEAIVHGDSNGNSKEFSFLINPYRGLNYFTLINRLNFKDTASMTYTELRNYLEKEHLVIGENQLPSYSEYELLKSLMLQNSNLIMEIANEEKAAYLIPHTSRRLPAGGAKTIAEANDFLSSDDSTHYTAFRNNLVSLFLINTLEGKDNTSGILRMNPAYILAFLKKDYPLTYKKLSDNPKMLSALNEKIYEEFANALVDIVQDILKKNHNADFVTLVVDKILGKKSLKSKSEKTVATALKVLRINSRINKHVLSRLLSQNDVEKWPMHFILAEGQRKIVQGFINQTLNEHLDSKTQFKIQRALDEDLPACLQALQSYVQTIGTNSGEYEKLIKSLSNLILLSLSTHKVNTLYKAATMFYYALPEHIEEKPDIELLGREDNLDTCIELRDALYNLRKNDSQFTELVNGLLMNHLLSYEHLKAEYKISRHKKLLEGLFIATSNPYQTQLFRKPFTSISGFNEAMMQGIIYTFKMRVQKNQTTIRKLIALKNKIMEAENNDRHNLYADRNYHKLMDILGNDENFADEFEKMFSDGLLVSKSMIQQIDEMIESLKEKHKKWIQEYSLYIPENLKADVTDSISKAA